MSKVFELPIKVEAIPYVKKGDGYKFLIIKRVSEDGGFWQPVTGTVESSESLVDCVYREIAEEIGVQKEKALGISDMFYAFSWKKGDRLIYEYVYGVELKREIKVNLSFEHDDYRWCGFDEAIEALEKDNNKKAYQEFKKIFLDNK